eukprot:1257252-Prymnesium_polylepis.1
MLVDVGGPALAAMAAEAETKWGAPLAIRMVLAAAWEGMRSRAVAAATVVAAVVAAAAASAAT